ncbi:MAG: 23S rRNA (pseudouridine(1915)-N(3))-methyltransferase RlmH [Thermodesulfobacteriota bacterium]
MKITFISVGHLKRSCLADGVAEYMKRIKRYTPFEAVDVREEGGSAKTPKEEILRREGERILKKLAPGDFTVALAEGGRFLGSVAFSKFIGGLADRGTRRVCFIVGGPWGLHRDVLDAASTVLSLSRMTLPHDIARLVLAEQVYRAFTIMRGEPYSH